MRTTKTYIAPIYTLFLVSGATALAYQVIWTRMLVRTFGATSFAVSTVLAAYMAGLALGSYLFGKMIDKRGNPVLVYGVLELGIGIFAFVFPLLVGASHPLFKGLYASLGGRFYLLSLIRFVLVFAILLIPTTLMGGTLPILSRYVTRSLSDLAGRVGLLYSINTFGAVVGTFATGFLIMPALGMKMTTYAAIAANVAIFLISLLLARTAGGRGATVEAEARAEGPRRSTAYEKTVLAAFFFTGLAALSAEVIWMRVLALVVGTTTYAFTTMLTSFLLGLALGSAVFARIAQRTSKPGTVFAVLVALIGFVVFGTIVAFGRLPFAYMRLFASVEPTWLNLISLQFLLSVALLIVPTFLMGGTFPLVARIYAKDLSHVGARIGTAYAFNTLGSICGSFLGSFVLLELLGVQYGMVTVAVVYLLVGLILLAALTEPVRRGVRLAGALVLVAGAVLMVVLSPGWDKKLMTSGVYTYSTRYKGVEGLRQILDTKTLLFYDEGPGATVSVERATDSVLSLRIDGKTDASSGEDMITQELISHLPLLLHDDPDSILIIGLGSGVSLSSALAYPVEHLDCVELLDNVIAGARYFDPYTGDVLSDPRVNMMIGDGRNHVRLVERKYDVIVSQPTNPWISGVGDLFTIEYFREAKDHLKPGGLMTAWLALYHMGDREVRATLKSFVSVFPYATLWMSNEADIVLVGSFDPLRFDESMIERMERPAVKADLERVGIDELSDVLSCLLMDGDELRRYADQVDILHTDDNMLLEYYASRRMAEVTFPDHLARMLSVFHPRDFGLLPAEVGNDTRNKVGAKRLTMQGSVERLAGNAAKTVELYSKAYAMAPTDRYVASMYGNLHIDWGDTMLARGQWGRATEHFKQAVGNVEAHMAWIPHDGLGQCYIAMGEYPAAKQELLEALQHNPYYALTYYNLGVVSTILGEPEMAVESYERCLELDPENVDASNNLAWQYAVMGENLERALELARAAVDAEPHTNHFDTLGWVYYKMGDLENAVRSLERSLELGPDNAEATLHLAVVSIDRGDNSRARTLLARVLELDRAGEFGVKAGELLNGMGKE
jgi:spermidine synthase